MFGSVRIAVTLPLLQWVSPMFIVDEASIEQHESICNLELPKVPLRLRLKLDEASPVLKSLIERKYPIFEVRLGIGWRFFHGTNS